MKLKRNLLFQIAYQLLIIITPLITSPYVSRVLGAARLGVYSYTYSIVNYFTIFAMLGTQNYGSRAIAECRNNRVEASKIFSEILTMQMAAASISMIMYSIYLLFSDTNEKLIASIEIIYILACFININWLFFGFEEFKTTVIRNTIVKIVSILGIFIFVKGQGDLWRYVLILAGSELISQIALVPFLKKYVDFSMPKVQDVKRHIKPNLILFVPAIAYSLNHVLDKTMIGLLSDYEQSGYYYNVEKIINIPKGIITGIGVVMMPRISSNIVAGKEKDNKKYLSNFLYVISFLSIGMAFGFSAISEDFVPFFFGAGFEQCIVLLTTLSFALIFMSLSDLIRMQFLIPNNYDSVYAKALFLGAAANVTINVILIPKYGAVGAVIATIIAEAVVFVYEFVFTNKKERLIKNFCSASLFILPGISMYLLVKYVSLTFVNAQSLVVVIKIVIGAAIYTIGCSLIILVIKPSFLIGLIKKNR